MFHIGQQVVCIDDSWVIKPPEVFPANLKVAVKNQLYLIRGFDRSCEFILLEEIVNDPCTNGEEPCFDPTYFRPTKDTSIECFQKLLSPTPKKKVESA